MLILILSHKGHPPICRDRLFIFAVLAGFLCVLPVLSGEFFKMRLKVLMQGSGQSIWCRGYDAGCSGSNSFVGFICETVLTFQNASALQLQVFDKRDGIFKKHATRTR